MGRTLKYQIEIQALLISIKSALDRLVSLFSYYYKGIMPHTTFGRVEHSKSKGFMDIVTKGKDNDNLLEFINDNYEEWINIVVAPRDMIIHYNDLSLTYQFDSKLGREIPVHYNEKLIKTKEEKNKPIYSFNHENLQYFVMSYKIFIDEVFNQLLDKETIIKKERI